jgi:protein SCO1/2
MRLARAMSNLRALTLTLLELICLFSPALSAAKKDSTLGPLPGLSIYNLTSQWTTQDGTPVRLESLRGRPVVVAMIYLSCPDVCPLIAENMEQIQTDLSKQLARRVTFALFTFDSTRDSPEKLKAYASARGLNTKHWTLFHSDDAAARELAAALDVSYRKRDDGQFDHSVVISLLNAEGVIVYRQVGLRRNTQEFVSKIRELELGGAEQLRINRDVPNRRSPIAQ